MNIAGGHLAVSAALLLPMSITQLRNLRSDLVHKFERNPSRNVSQDIAMVDEALREKGEEVT